MGNHKIVDNWMECYTPRRGYKWQVAPEEMSLQTLYQVDGKNLFRSVFCKELVRCRGKRIY